MSAEQADYEDQYGAADGSEYQAGRNGGAEDYYDEDEQTFTIDEPGYSNRDHSKADTMTNSQTTAAELGAPTGPRGVKRKETSDERHVESGATTALLLSDLHWWTSEDELRGWVNEAQAEHDLKDVSFNEHKVNGKSKGQAYLEFYSTQSASAAKHHIESLTEGSGNTRTFIVQYNPASNNPFKTLPKDAPPRDKENRYGRGGAYNSTPPRGDYGSGFRGRGRGFDRGGYNNQNFNRNFSTPAAGFNSGGYSNNTAGMMNNFGFNRGGGMMGNNMRGNMGGFRGGRGGMNNMMAMGMNMGMNPIMAGMGMQGFQGNNLGMFNQAGFTGDWNQPGAKRQRQE